VSVERDVVYTADRGQAITLDLYRPVGTPPRGGWPAVVAFPGGGWQWASKTQYGGSVGQLARHGFVVAVADYTFASATPGSRSWPMNFNDAQNAVRWVRRHAERLDVNPDAIAAEGVSSGAYLASLLGVHPEGPSAGVEAVVDFYGPVDLGKLWIDAPRDDRHLMTFLGGTPAQVPERYVTASVDSYVTAGAPPFFIAQGTVDRAVPPSQTNLLVNDLKQAGVPYSLVYLVGLGHGFEFYINPRYNLLPQVVTFLDQALNHRPITTG
jgi:acetyl esterase/lipase